MTMIRSAIAAPKFNRTRYLKAHIAAAWMTESAAERREKLAPGIKIIAGKRAKPFKLL